MPAALATAFDQATSSTTNRQNALLNVQATGDTDQLTELVAPLQIESTTLGNLMNDLVGTLSNRVGTLTDQARSDALRDSALVLGALLAAVGIALYVARSLVFPMRILHAAAVDAATNRLPDTIRQVRTGRHVDWRSVEPVPVRTTEEIGQLARAFDEMHRQAVRLAGEQAELRGQVSEMFMTLARRSQSLVELQLSVIEDLETDEQDPQRLDDLFRIDHIATRLRRNGENLQVLAGGSPSRPDDGPVTMIELLRAATSEVKDYRRIALGNAPSGLVRAQAAADVVHILAELLENATRFSPPQDKVVLTADRGADGGVLIEVVDTGLGMAADDLDAANTRLAAGDSVSPETTRRMGLFVVGRLAAPHGVTVKLRRTTTRVTQAGITASVHVPGALVIAEALPNSPLSRPGRAAAQELMSGSRPALPGVPFNPAGPAATTGSMVPINGNLTGPANGDHPANGPMTGPLNGMANGAVNGRVNGVAHNPGPHRTMPESSEPAWPRNEPSPIFDQMITGWFMEDPHHPNQQPRKPQPPPPTAQTPRNSAPPPRRDPWAGPADVARRAAEEAVGHAKHSAVTPKGLPVRRPGAQLAPGTANPTGKPAAGRQGNPADFRDPAAVRNNLARHYSGMRAARQRTQGDAESSVEGKADPK
jgi:signal transduction histidine kinase